MRGLRRKSMGIIYLPPGHCAPRAAPRDPLGGIYLFPIEA